MDQYGEQYRRIVDILLEEGHSVQYEQVFKQKLKDIISETDEKKVDYYKKFLRWINNADLVIAEASFPSTVHIGYELNVALEKGKPVIVLFQEGKAPVFLEGVKSDKLIVQKYRLDELREILTAAINKAAERRETRFNFFIPRRLVAYLDWISKKRRIPRAVYLRQLLRGEMRMNKDYQV